MSIASRIKDMWRQHDEIEEQRKEFQDEYDRDTLHLLETFLRVDRPYHTARDFENHSQVDPVGAAIRLHTFGITKECCRGY